MAHAFKCDFCHEYKDGAPNCLYIKNNVGIVVCSRDICKDCYEKIKTLDLSKQKEVDKE